MRDWASRTRGITPSSRTPRSGSTYRSLERREKRRLFQSSRVRLFSGAQATWSPARSRIRRPRRSMSTLRASTRSGSSGDAILNCSQRTSGMLVGGRSRLPPIQTARTPRRSLYLSMSPSGDSMLIRCLLSTKVLEWCAWHA